MNVLRTQTVKARKRHECNSCLWLREGEIEPGELTFTELREIARVKANGYQIQPGEKYVFQVQADGVCLYDTRFLPSIDAICQRLKLYPND
jgi:hypothetical protein